ncbi:hypothetical protein [Candidatus Solirubrobacter pratensis]|uniref:hypothetical protein n=1 Tax=Candidatus Solirubrobacter pratensis TaxID=1298857 RepID=UPI0003F6CAF4|nr:hypothetical protein [Candidatus Solirubrobacter pratensis]
MYATLVPAGLLQTIAVWLALAAPAAAQSPFEPVPIGPGAQYQPPARWPLAGAAAFRGIHGDVRSGIRVHLELFADRLVVVVPGGIGVSGGRTTRYGFVTAALWHAPAWTTEAGGVIHLARPGMRLGDVFSVWGEALGRDRLLTFTGRVRTFVNGTEVAGDPAAVELRDRDQVVVEVGGYVPPHPSFTFTPLS